MSINKQIRRYRVLTAVGFTVALLSLALAVEQVVVSDLGQDVGEQPLDATRLHASIEAREQQIRDLEVSQQQMADQLAECQRLYQDEIQINNALREDLKVATARIRRGNAK